MFENLKFRCHSIGNLMTEPKLKADKEAGNLSETTKSFLMEIYVEKKYGRKKDISNKYIEKGLLVEDEAINLYSRLKLDQYSKNEERLSNEFIHGVPDIIGDEVIDVKSSWDIFTFFATLNKEVNTTYYWQLQAYLALTGLKVAKLAYCLIDTPETLINDDKRKLMYKMNVVTTEDPEYIKACEELEKNMIYSDIPLANRVIEFTIERNEDDINKIYDKVSKARKYLIELDSKIC
jgi:hypothetical protein